VTEQEPLITDSARRHGVGDADMLHAFRNPVRTFQMDEDMTLVIGADSTAGWSRSRWSSVATTLAR
jgi:hypothetical protein